MSFKRINKHVHKSYYAIVANTITYLRLKRMIKNLRITFKNSVL